MRRFASLISLVMLILTSQSFAAGSKRHSRAARALSEEPVTVSSPAKPVRVNVGPGLAVSNGATAFALNFGATKQINPEYPIHVGADLALYFFGAASIQLLGTGYYLISLPNTHQTRLIAGLSLGPAITTGVGGNLLLELLFRVGAEVNAAKDLVVSFEPKFGILGGSFIFLPQVNGIFSF